MPETPTPPKDYVTPQERLSNQDWSGVAKTGLASMAPADKGWVLAVVVIITVLQISDFFQSKAQVEQYEHTATRLSSYLVLVEEDQQRMSQTLSEERKELLRIIENLTETVSRQANREGREAVRIMHEATTPPEQMTNE